MNHHEKMIKDYRKRFIISLILTAPIIILSPLFQELLNYKLELKGSTYILFALSTIIYLYGGKPFIKGSIKELRARKPGMMTLITVAISASYFYSSAVVFGLKGKFFFWELTTLITIMLLGHWIEMKSIMGASKALESLARLMPKKAHLIKNNKIIDVALTDLKKNSIVLVKPGEKIPADGVIINGKASINESMLTGESKPVNKTIGDKVIGGSINGSTIIKIKITNTGENSYLSQVIKLVKESQASKSKAQDLATRAAKWLTIIALSIGAATFITWMAILNNLSFAMERMITVIVITCPHALGLAVPLVIAVSTSLSAKNGLLIRNRIAFENARNINTVIFDKTGTLTKGDFGVTNIIPLSNIKKKELLLITASLEANSTHPIAQGIIKKVNNQLMKVKRFKNLPGQGVKGVINNNEYLAVGNNYLKNHKLIIKNKIINELINQGRTMVYLLKNKQVIGAIALGDSVRDESREAINQLKAMNIKCLMLTGDNEQVAKWVSHELKLDGYYAEVMPHDKSRVVKELQSKGLKVAMVGDGVNDAPALTQANAGIAIGAGTDVAIESADIVLIRDDPRDVVSIIKLAKATYKKMKQNLAWATGYNLLTIPLAAGVLYNQGIILTPAIGAALMTLSTVIVAINAQFIKVK